MSTIRRLWNVAKGTSKTWGQDSPGPDPALERELEQARLRQARPRRPVKVDEGSKGSVPVTDEEPADSAVGPPLKNPDGSIKKTL